jgi:hypothetical protein
MVLQNHCLIVEVVKVAGIYRPEMLLLIVILQISTPSEAMMTQFSRPWGVAALLLEKLVTQHIGVMYVSRSTTYTRHEESKRQRRPPNLEFTRVRGKRERILCEHCRERQMIILQSSGIQNSFHY